MTAAHDNQDEYRAIAECPCTACRAHQLEVTLPPHFATYNMQMNAGKTTHEEFRPGFRKTTSRKTLGNHISPEKELEARRKASNHTMNSMCRIRQSGPRISTDTRLRLYKACIRSRLTYNAATIGYTVTQLEKLN